MRCFFRVFLPELLYLRTGMLSFLFSRKERGAGRGGSPQDGSFGRKGWKIPFCRKKESAPAGGGWGAERKFFYFIFYFSSTVAPGSILTGSQLFLIQTGMAEGLETSFPSIPKIRRLHACT